jgi:ribonuclease HI
MSLFSEDTLSGPAKASPWIFAHCDGGSRGNPGPAGFGALITDAAGNTLAELSEFLGVRTNNFAEYSGLLAVLEWAITNGRRRVKVVSDSELMVKQIQGKYKVNSPDLKPLWQEARNRIAKLDGFEISHALRHKNKEADALANQAMDRGTRRGGGGAVELLRAKSAVAPVAPAPAPPAMFRGFTKDGSIHLLGGATLPDGIFVKIIRE